MSEEELIEILRAFENNRVEQLEEPAKYLFYAIMKIADERDRLNNIIKRLEKELFGMYVDIAGWDEDYAKKLIKKIEDSSQECELLKNNKKDVSIKSDELKCQFSDIWEYGDR